MRFLSLLQWLGLLSVQHLMDGFVELVLGDQEVVALFATPALTIIEITGMFTSSLWDNHGAINIYSSVWITVSKCLVGAFPLDSLTVE